MSHGTNIPKYDINQPIILTLKVPSKFVADDILNFFFYFFRENKSVQSGAEFHIQQDSNQGLFNPQLGALTVWANGN